jgi:hypothetical protein
VVVGVSAHWLTASANGTTPVGFGLPNLVVNVPAGKRLAKVIVQPVVHGTFVPANSSPADHAPVYMLETVTINSAEYPFRIIYNTERSLNMNWVVLYDPSVGLPNSRVYSSRYWGADQELGINTQCSYGGLGHSAISVTFSSGLFSLLATPLVINFSRQVTLKALYYD